MSPSTLAVQSSGQKLAPSAFSAPPRETSHPPALNVERSELRVPVPAYYLFPITYSRLQ